MEKKKLDTGKKFFDSQDAAPMLPEGFYSGDQLSNPNLRKFVEDSS